MSFDLNDPRLTAFALGEIDDDAERLAVEAEIANDSDALAFVEGIRETALLLSEELRKEPLPPIKSDLHKTIEQELQGDLLPPPVVLPIATASRGKFSWFPLSLAAGVVALVGGGYALLMPAVQSAREASSGRSNRTLLLAQSDEAPASASPAPAAPKSMPKPAGPNQPAYRPIDDFAEAPAAREGVAELAPPAPPSVASTSSAAPAPVYAPAPAAPSPVMASSPDASQRFAGGQGQPATTGAPGPMASPAQPGSNLGYFDGQRAQSGPNARGVQNAFALQQQANNAPAPIPPGDAASTSGMMGYGRPGEAGVPGPGGGRMMGEMSGGLTAAGGAVPSAGGMGGSGGGMGGFGGMSGMSGRPGVNPAQTRGLSARGGTAPAQSGQTFAKDVAVGGDSKRDADREKFSELGLAKREMSISADKLDATSEVKLGLKESLARTEPLPGKKPGNMEEGRLKQLSDPAAAVSIDAPAKQKQKEAEQLAPARVPAPELAAEPVALPQIAPITDNPFLPVVGNELSTFSIDVDTAAYSMVRQFLNQNQAPPRDAVRIEEMLNYFSYNDPGPKDDKPFAFNVEMAACPWNANNRLVRVGIKAKTIDADKRPSSNLVFLIDVSGSMSDINKLPLLKAGMKLLVDQLTENDRVAIVVYASDVRVHLPSTPCHKKKVIIDALDTLQSGGSTAGGRGIELAYREAVVNFIKGGTNRVILATDGDFNVGKSKEELLKESEERAKSGVFLTVLGFGEGNLQEAFMEQLADKGNGQYAYIDSIAEARKVLVKEMSGTLVAVAKDVKIQVEFNPAKVQTYRLIGYENRVMAAQDFRNDKKDAGEIGAGHGVTALYEITPVGASAPVALADKTGRPLKYGAAEAAPGTKTPAPAAKASPESLTIYLRYKAPDGDKAQEIEQGVVDKGLSYGQASTDFKFAAAVAGFGMLLRDSPYKGSLTFSAVSELATPATLDDKAGYRTEFVELVKKAQMILGR